MQTWNESLHLAKEKLLDQFDLNPVALASQDQAEVSNGGDQLTRNSLVDRNDGVCK